MGLLESLEVLERSILSKDFELKASVQELESKRVELTKVEKQHLDKVNQVTLDAEVIEVIKKLFEQVSTEGVKFLEGMINEALRMVFTDEYYKFRIEFGSRGNEKTAEFLLHNGVVESRLSECGGGVQVLIAFVFRIYYIMRTGLNRFVAMDETMSQLSPQYLEAFMGFMRMLVNTYGFKFFWISHSPYLEAYCDRYYEMNKGRVYVKK